MQNDNAVNNFKERALKIAEDEGMPANRRAEAIDFIVLGKPAMYTAPLNKLIAANEPSSVQIAALRTLSVIPGTGFQNTC